MMLRLAPESKEIAMIVTLPANIYRYVLAGKQVAPARAPRS
jgi:hypothetical protein